MNAPGSTVTGSRLVLFASVVAAATAACSAERPPFRVGLPSLRTDSTTCQFGDRGVRVEVEDVADGVDLTVTTIRDLDELRHRVRDAAAMYGPGAQRGLGHNGKHGTGGRHGLGLAELRPPVKAVALDVPNGAILHVTAVDPATVAEVREEVQARAERAQWGECR